MRALEGFDLHALVIHAHHRWHSRDVALEIAGGADHLAGEADVGERHAVAVAEAPGLLLAGEVGLARLQRLEAPVREPAVSRRLVELQLLFHVAPDAGYDQR